MYSVNVAGGEEVDLTPFDAVQARIVATDRDRPDEILVAVNNRNPQVHDGWRINTRSAEGELQSRDRRGCDNQLDAMVELVQQQTRQLCSGHEQVQVDLTAGLDSRAVFATSRTASSPCPWC